MKIIEGFNQAQAVLSRQPPQGAPATDDREQLVRQIVNDVRHRGDAALFEYTEKLDGVRLTALEVHKGQIDSAYKEIDKGLLAALKLAAERITAYHVAQKKALVRNSKNKKLGWLIRPLEKIGVYAPGFQAPLPSTVLMTALLAKVAGVKEIIMATPPGKQGRVAPITLAAAAIAGIDRVFSIGGAQAIAALAFGTESVPRVDKVCGPGNIYVYLAKKMVFGDVGIDGFYGPSEVIIIADDTANPAYCAADLLAQAEHGSGPTAILIATSRKLADKVNIEIEEQLKTLPRKDIITGSLDSRGMIAIVATVEEAIELANLYAPEHLCLVVANAVSHIEKVKNAGCLFIGENSIEALVDYAAGPSHVLPTGGTARFGSGLNILDFVKLISLVNMDEKDIRQLGQATSIIARAEGLDAHARAVAKRLETTGQGGR
jgi:histidinol dehydrogenase